MNRITAAEFKKAVAADPLWAGNLKEDVTVEDYCDMDGSEIAALSPHLTFAGRDEEGNCASFRGCKDLIAGEGTFHGFVDFGPLESVVDGETVAEPCGISALEITVTCPNNNGQAVNLAYTENMRFLAGRFPGHVEARGSELEAVDITVTGTDADGRSASFAECASMEMLSGSFTGSLDLEEVWMRRWGGVTIHEADTNGKKLYVNGARIKSCGSRPPEFREEEIADLEGANLSFVQMVKGRKNSRCREPYGAAERGSWPGAKQETRDCEITAEIISDLIRLLKASSLKARETRIGYLNKDTYFEIRERVKTFIDWDEGGVKRETLKRIKEDPKLEALIPDLQKAIRSHRKYMRFLVEISNALKTGSSENPKVLKYANPAQGSLTNLGSYCFGGDEKIKNSLNLTPKVGPDQIKGKTTAELLALDNRLAGESRSPRSWARQRLLAGSVVGSAVLFILSTIAQKGTERVVAEPFWDWIGEQKARAVSKAKEWFASKDPNVLGRSETETDDPGRTQTQKEGLLGVALAPVNLELRRQQEETTRKICGNPEAEVSSIAALDSVLRDFQNMDRILEKLRSINAKAEKPKKTTETWVAMH